MEVNLKLIEEGNNLVGAVFWHVLTELSKSDDFQDGYKEYTTLFKENRMDDLTQVTIKACIKASSALGETPDNCLNLIVGMYQHSGNKSIAQNLYGTAALYEYAYPTYDIGHRLAASFIVTNVADDVLAEVLPPFPAFTIRVPDKLIWGEGSGGLSDIVQVLVCRLRDSEGKYGWFFNATMRCGAVIWGHADTLKTLGRHNDAETYGPLDRSLEKVDERASFMLARLISNCMLMATNKDQVKPIGMGHKNSGHSLNTRKGKPQRRVFRFTTAVNHDFREVVSQYGAGESKKLNVQSIVAGHWKSQPYGPKSELRKRLFVEPYFRGPEDMPIAVKSHRL